MFKNDNNKKTINNKNQICSFIFHKKHWNQKNIGIMEKSNVFSTKILSVN